VGLWAGVGTKRQPFQENSETFEIKGLFMSRSWIGWASSPEYSEKPVVVRHGNFSLSSN